LYIKIPGHQKGRDDGQVTSYGDLLQVTGNVLTLLDDFPKGFFPTSGSDEGKEIGSFRQITGGNFLHLEIPKHFLIILIDVFPYFVPVAFVIGILLCIYNKRINDETNHTFPKY
jgi:hypothetical protein